MFTYVYVGCCVSQGSAELELFVCLPMFMLVLVYLRALLNWSCLFTYVYVGCCVSQSSAELELFVCLPMLILVVVYLRAAELSCLFVYLC